MPTITLLYLYKIDFKFLFYFLLLVFFFFLPRDKISHSPGWPQSHYAMQPMIELLILPTPQMLTRAYATMPGHCFVLLVFLEDQMPGLEYAD